MRKHYPNAYGGLILGATIVSLSGNTVLTNGGGRHFVDSDVSDEIERDIKADLVDTAIRDALRSADSSGKLRVVAAVTGIAGGEAELTKIMNGNEPLSIMDRGMLGMHMGLLAVI